MPTNTQKVIKGVSSQTIVTIVLGVVEILSFSIMSRLLSQKDFGYYAAIVAIATIFSALEDAGIGSALIQKKYLTKKYINNAFTLALLFGGFIACLLLLLAGVIANFVADETMVVPLRIYSITLLCQCLYSVNRSLMNRKLQFLRIGLIQLTSLIITTIVAVILALKGFGYYAILTKAVCTSILNMIISYFLVNEKFSFAFDLKVYKNIFNFGGWLMASAIFRNLAHQIDKLLMTSLFSIETLGLYTRPKEFINNIAEKFNSIFDTVLFPVLSTIQDDKERIQKSFIYTSYFLNILGMLVCLLFVFNSELIIRIFFGEKWLKDINNLFLIFSFLPIFRANGRICDIFLRSLALTKQQFIFRVIELTSSILFIVISFGYGVTALAVANVIGYTVVIAIKIAYVASKVHVATMKVYFTIISSLKVCLLFIPLYILCINIIPHNLGGNIVQVIIFSSLLILSFLIFPSLVGKRYRQEAYSKIIYYIKNKLIKSK